MQGTPWRPSTQHQETRVRTHENRRRRTKTMIKKKSPEKSRCKYLTKKSQVVKKQDVMFSRIGQSYNFNIKPRDVLKYGPYFCCSGYKDTTDKVATQSGHNRECIIRIMVEMEKDDNIYVAFASDIYQWRIEKKEVVFKDHDEGKAGKEGTPEKQEPRATS